MSSSSWSDAALVHANYYQFQPGEEVIQPRVEARMLLWCVAGTGTLQVGKSLFHFQPNHTLWLPWGTPRHYVAAKENPFRLGGLLLIPWHSRKVPVHRGVAHSSKDPVSGVWYRKDAAGFDGVHCDALAPQHPLRLLSDYLVQRFYHKSEAHSDDPRLFAGLLLRELDGFLAKTATRHLSATVQKLIRYCDAQFPARLSVATLAAQANRSVSWVERTFRSAIGCGPKEYQQQRAAEVAQTLLVQTSLPIAEVGRRVGYDDEFYFSKWFKTRSGHAPSHYRARYSGWG